MSDQYTITRWQAQLLSKQIELQAMIAANQQRLIESNSVAYTDDHFWGLQNDVECILQQIKESG